MAKEKKLRRLAPCPAYDVERIESWLQDMAGDGWLLDGDSTYWFGFFTFRKAAPQAVRYRLEPKQKIHSDYTNAPDDEAVELYREYGWEFVTAYHLFYIYRTADPDARELNTDLAVQAAALKLVRRNATASLPWEIFLLLNWFFRIRNEFYRFLVSFEWFIVPAFLLMLTVGLITSVKQFLHIRRLRKQLKENIPLDHNKPWRKNAKAQRAGKVAVTILYAFVLMSLFSSCFNAMSVSYANTPTVEFPGDPPFVTMADISPEGIFTAKKFSSYNTYNHYATSLAPNIIEWKEYGEIHTADGKVIDGSLSIDYYETVSPTLARGLVDDFLWYYQRYDDFRFIDAPDIDADYVVAFEYIFPTVLIQQDHIFICATVGLDYQEDYLLEEWVQLMAEYFNR